MSELAWVVTAGLCTVFAVLLAWPRGAGSSVAQSHDLKRMFATTTHAASWRAGHLLVAAVPLLVGLAVPFDRGPVLGAISAAAWVVGFRFWRRAREAADRGACQAAVLEVCAQMAADLRAGQDPGMALSRAGETWAPLAQVADTFRLGGDVTTALRAAADRPGAGELVWVAAAWQVAQRTGQGLARAMERVSIDLTALAATRRLVESELASARATARLMAGLPVVALAMGSGMGGDPWGFLLDTRVGALLLAVGGLLAALGMWWIDGLARSVTERAG